MDKNEYKLRTDEIRSLIQNKQYTQAAEIADTIDWKNAKGYMILCTISDLYKVNKRYKDALDILLLAYDRNPNSRMILYSLCELSIKVGDIVNAIEYCKEFKQVAPGDSGRYVLQYKIYTALGNKLEERIAVLEELQSVDFKEKWMYELARLYHLSGEGAKCVEECNQIIVYFGEGKYVIKALELMKLHTPLSGEHEALYIALTTRVADDVKVGTLVGQYNPDDLQKELASNLQEVLTSDTPSEAIIYTSEAVSETSYYSEADLLEYTVSESESAAQEYYESEVSDDVKVYDAAASEPEKSEPETDDSIFNTTMYKPVTIDIPLEEEATKVMDVRAVNRALSQSEPVREVIHDAPKKEALHIVPPSDTGFKGQVIEPGGKTWDMHEIDLGSSQNEAIKYPNYDDMVSLEGDGQLSIVLPEQENVEKQITGQISIDDILLEWERMKSESDKKWQEGIKQSVINKTNDMFANFERESQNGLLQELEIKAVGGEKVTLSVEDQKAMLFGEQEDTSSQVSESIYEEIIILEEEYTDEQPAANGTGSSESIADTVLETETANEATSEEQVTVSAGNGDVSEIFFGEDSSFIDGVAAVSSGENAAIAGIESEAVDGAQPYTDDEEQGPSPEELRFDRTPFLADKEEKEEVSDDTGVIPNLENLDYFMQYAANIEEKEIAEKAIFGAAQIIADGHDEPGDIFKDEVVSEADVSVSSVSAEISEDEAKASESSLEAASESVKTSEEAEISESESEVLSETEISESEALSESETMESESEAVSEPEETSEKPASLMDLFDDNSDSEAPAEETDADESSEEKDSEDSEKSDSPLTEAQLERFDDFIHSEGMAEKIDEALKTISMEASHGNMIIGSDDVDGAVDLSKALVQEIYDGGLITGKFGKTKASTLNNKDISETFDKFADGAIIIQDVGDLKPETIAAIEEKIADPELRIIIIITANYRAKHKFIMNNTEFMKHFDISIDLISMDDKELVDYAVEYARNQERAIDEMALLALHTKIEEKQTNAHSVKISEVREIIDEAIARSNKKTPGHFFDVLFGNRYDEDDMIILRESDFE